MEISDLSSINHRRQNILTGEWILVSPQRTNRPWQGKLEVTQDESTKVYDPDCYLCPGNKRANDVVNPHFKDTFVFTNDFPALSENTSVKNSKISKHKLLPMKTERGICRVLVFTPRHDLTLAEMSESEIEKVIITWQQEFNQLSKLDYINYIQIFENKGSMMGCSNPHPHCQIWAQKNIPMEPMKELKNFKSYYKKNNRSLLTDYLKLELRLKERIVYENSSFVALVPFWAIWPYEILIITKRKLPNILKLNDKERRDFAEILKIVTVKYDNLFRTSFPYSSGLHQAPTDGKDYKEWHLHMHFYPPLLRSANVKKFLVGYEMLAEPQRDITPERSADILRGLPKIHYKNKL